MRDEGDGRCPENRGLFWCQFGGPRVVDKLTDGGGLCLQFLTEQPVEGRLGLRIKPGRIDLATFECVIDEI